MTRYYMVMVFMQATAENPMTCNYEEMVFMQATAENPMTCNYEDIPLSGTIHTKRFAAFFEMQHAKDNPQYAGKEFYIKEITAIHWVKGEDPHICWEYKGGSDHEVTIAGEEDKPE